jgi:hypothetical protein
MVRSLWLVTAAVTLPALAWAQMPPPAPAPPQPVPPIELQGTAPAPPETPAPPQEAPPPPPPAAWPPPQPPQGPVPGNVPTVWGPTEPQEVIAENANERAIGRPRFSAAIGMGASFDSVGIADGHDAVPTFVGVLGMGDGLLGLNLGAYATSATRAQRQKDSPVDRLAVDLFGVLRPAARYQRDDHSFGMRVLHSLAAELGPGLERAGRSNISGTRFLVHVGATVDLPISTEYEATEVRVRLGVRKNIGLYTPKLYGATASDVTDIRDTALDVYAALAVVF